MRVESEEWIVFENKYLFSVNIQYFNNLVVIGIHFEFRSNLYKIKFLS